MIVRKFIVLAAALAVVGCTDAEAGPGLPPPSGPEAAAGPHVPPVESFAEAATEDTSRRRIGSFEVKHRVEVATQSGGTLAAVMFDVGDAVKSGDVVFRLKGKPTQLNLARSRNALDAANKRVEASERDFKRLEELFAAGATTPAMLDQARVGYEAAQIQAEDAKVAVSLGRNGVSELTTRAPISGVVTERRKDPGEAVTSMPPTVVLVIEDHSTLEMHFQVPELSLRQFGPGASVDVVVPALEETLTASVTRTGSAVNPRTRTIDIICDVPNPDGRLKPGMSVEVTPSAPPKPAPAEAPAVDTPDAEASDAEATPDAKEGEADAATTEATAKASPTPPKKPA